MRVIEGYGALPAFGLLNQCKSETQGQLSQRGRGTCSALVFSFLGSRDRYNTLKLLRSYLAAKGQESVKNTTNGRHLPSPLSHLVSFCLSMKLLSEVEEKLFKKPYFPADQYWSHKYSRRRLFATSCIVHTQMQSCHK